MTNTSIKVEKTLYEVKMWVHPEGLVTGFLYVRVATDDADQEDPRAVLNQAEPFVVLKRNLGDEIRFYNRSSIVRVEYQDNKPEQDNMTHLNCRMTMMDGSVIDGQIHEILPPEYARLYDYLNQANDRFIKIYTDTNEVCLVNKSYVIQVTTDLI